MGSKRIISFIEDDPLVEKILESAAGGSNANHLRDPMTRQMKPISSMINPHRPARMIRFHYGCFGATGYQIDVDYPIDLSWRSSTCWVVAESEA